MPYFPSTHFIPTRQRKTTFSICLNSFQLRLLFPLPGRIRRKTREPSRFLSIMRDKKENIRTPTYEKKCGERNKKAYDLCTYLDIYGKILDVFLSRSCIPVICFRRAWNHVKCESSLFFPRMFRVRIEEISCFLFSFSPSEDVIYQPTTSILGRRYILGFKSGNLKSRQRRFSSRMMDDVFLVFEC